MLPAVAGLSSYQKSLLTHAGAQQQTIATILSQALGNSLAFRNPDTVQKLSTAIRQIPLTHLTPFLSAFRKLIDDCNLSKDTVTFVVLKDQFAIPRAIVIAFSQTWAVNLSNSTSDQTQPIVLLKSDETHPPFSAGILKVVLTFIRTQKLPAQLSSAVQKKAIKAADVYGIPTLRLAIHRTLGRINNVEELLNWLRFSHSIEFQDKTPNRDLRTCLQLLGDGFVKEDTLNQFTLEEKQTSSIHHTINFWLNFKKQERDFSQADEGFNPFQYSVSWQERSIDLWGPDPICQVFRDGSEELLIRLAAGVIKRGTLPKLRMHLLRDEEICAFLNEVSNAKEKERCLLTKLEFSRMGMKTTTASIVQKFLAEHPSISKITLDNSCSLPLQRLPFSHLTTFRIRKSFADEDVPKFMTAFCSTPPLILGSFTLKGKIDESSFPTIFQALRAVTSLHTLKFSVELVDQKDNKCPLSKETADEIMTSLTLHTQLTRLSWACGQIAQGALTTFIQRLRALTSLRVLELWYNKLDTASLSKVADSIPALLSMRVLKLDLNNIQGVFPLAQRLTGPCSLTSLDLRKNRLGNEGVGQLAEALRTNTSLQNLDLSFNNIGIEGMHALAITMSVNQKLKTLLLGVRNGRHERRYDDKAKEMKHEPNHFNDQVAITFAESLRQNTSLITLELPGSCGLPGAQAIARMLNSQTTLRTLQVDLNRDVEVQDPLKDNPRFKRTHEHDRYRNAKP